MAEVKMDTFVIELREKAGLKRTAPLLVVAVDKVAAQEWAEAHAAGNDLELVTGATSVPDVVEWAKKAGNVSRSLTHPAPATPATPEELTALVKKP